MVERATGFEPVTSSLGTQLGRRWQVQQMRGFRNGRKRFGDPVSSLEYVLGRRFYTPNGHRNGHHGTHR